MHPTGLRLLKVCLCAVMMVAAGCGESEPTPAPAASSDNASKSPGERSMDERIRDLTRKFFTAMLENDEAALRSIVLPDENASVLWKGKKPEPQQEAMARAMYQSITVRRVREGDEVKVMDQTRVVLPGNSTDDAPMYVLTMAGRDMGMPFRYLRTDDGWKIDARPLIASRMAAIQMQAELDAKNEDAAQPK